MTTKPSRADMVAEAARLRAELLATAPRLDADVKAAQEVVALARQELAHAEAGLEQATIAALQRPMVGRIVVIEAALLTTAPVQVRDVIGQVEAALRDESRRPLGERQQRRQRMEALRGAQAALLDLALEVVEGEELAARLLAITGPLGLPGDGR